MSERGPTNRDRRHDDALRPAARSMRRCASCRARSATRCSRSTRFCRAVDDIADSDGRATTAWLDLAALARRHRRALCRAAAAAARRPRRGGARVRPGAGGFPRRHRRHGDGCRRGHPRARSSRRSISIATASPARSAGCRCASSAWRRGAGDGARASSRPRAAAHQHPARPRRGCRHRPALSAARSPARCRHRRPPIRTRCWPIRARPRPAPRWSSARAAHFAAGRRHHGALLRAARAGAALMAEVYQLILDGLMRARLARRRASAYVVPRLRVMLDARCATRSSDAAAPSTSSAPASPASPPRSALARTARRRCRVIVHEATEHAGGRCRSYHDPALGHDDRQRQPSAAVGQSRGARLSATRIGAADRLHRARPRRLSLSSISRPASAGRCASTTAGCPGGSSIRRRRVPGTRALDYLGAGAAAVGRRQQADRRGHRAARARSIDRLVIRCCSRRSTPSPPQARPRSPARSCARRSLRGGAACRPLIAARRPSTRLRRSGARVSAGARRHDRVSAIELRSLDVRRQRRSARSISATTRSRWRRRCRHPRGAALVAARARAGLHGADRVPRHRQRAFPHRAAAGSAADPRRRQRHRGMAVRLSGPPVGHDQRRRPAARQPREELARDDLGRGRGQSPALTHDLPPWQIVRERRATFAATPAENAQRPRAATPLAQSRARRRLDRDRACRRRSKARSARATAAAELAIGRALTTPSGRQLDESSDAMPAYRAGTASRDVADAGHRPLDRGRDARSADAAAAGRPLGVRARGRRHHPGRIRAAAPLSRRAGGRRARGQDRRLSAPHPGRAWRLAAVPRAAPSTSAPA